jgi:DNA-binding protein HU-beta
MNTRLPSSRPPARACHNSGAMARAAKIATSFPSVSETAERLGVSKREAAVLSEMAERSQKTGVFAIPGLGRLVRVTRKTRAGRNPATGESIKTPAKKVVKFRVVKAAKNTIVPSTKK